MDELSGLASTLAAGVGDVRGCLILCRDGLVVGSFLPDGEGSVRPAWIRFAAVGEPERGFVQFGTETWCYVRRGPYAAFVVAGPAARPVLLIDRMDRLLLSAEETRVNRPAAGDQPVVPAAQSSRRRTPLHPDRPAGEPVVNGARGEAAVAAAVRAASAGEGTERPTDALGSIARERRIRPTGPPGNRPVPRPPGRGPRPNHPSRRPRSPPGSMPGCGTSRTTGATSTASPSRASSGGSYRTPMRVPMVRRPWDRRA